MKCPYLHRVKVHTQSWVQIDKNDDENEKHGGITSDLYEYEFAECEKENCGAYYDNRCHYHDNNR